MIEILDDMAKLEMECTCLKTRTDQPRLTGSDPRVCRSEERTCAVSVFESGYDIGRLVVRQPSQIVKMRNLPVNPSPSSSSL